MRVRDFLLWLCEERGPSQPRQELADSFPDAGLSGAESSHTSFEGFSDPQTCPEALLNAARSLCPVGSSLFFLGDSFWG